MECQEAVNEHWYNRCKEWQTVVDLVGKTEAENSLIDPLKIIRRYYPGDMGKGYPMGY